MLKRPFAFISVGLAVSLTAIAAQASTLYVSTSGLDTNAGTISSPWKTIQHAANAATAGDTVYIRGGTYNESVTINVSGSAAGGSITFQSYSGETAIVDGTGLTVPGQTGSSTSSIAATSGSSGSRFATTPPRARPRFR
jgi:hypothetical protein